MYRNNKSNTHNTNANDTTSKTGSGSGSITFITTISIVVVWGKRGQEMLCLVVGARQLFSDY